MTTLVAAGVAVTALLAFNGTYMYSELQWRKDDPGKMYVDFRIEKPTLVELVLAARKNGKTPSAWELNRVAPNVLNWLKS